MNGFPVKEKSEHVQSAKAYIGISQGKTKSENYPFNKMLFEVYDASEAS